MIQLIFLTLLTGVGGLFLGAVLGVNFGGRSSHSEAILLSFSAGTMIALVCFELLHEAMETGISLPAIAFSTLLGAGIVTFLDYIVDKRSGHSHDFITCQDCDEEFIHDENHEHCSHEEEHHQHHGHDHPQLPETGAEAGEHCGHGHHHKKTSHLQLFVAGIVMAAGVAIHNLPEGMTIGALYAGEGSVFTGALGMLLISIILDNNPEGMAISVPLLTGGMNKWKACGVAALSGVPTILGALLGYGLGDMGALGLALSLSFAAGTLMYVIFGEVLPQSINLYCSRKTAFAAIAGVAVGMLILAGHVHVH